MKNNYLRKEIHHSEVEIIVIRKIQEIQETERQFHCSSGKLGSTKKRPFRTFSKFVSLKSKCKPLLCPKDHLCSDQLVIPAAHKQSHTTVALVSLAETT